jgi:hypothetical protein
MATKNWPMEEAQRIAELPRTCERQVRCSFASVASIIICTAKETLEARSNFIEKQGHQAEYPDSSAIYADK